MSAAGSCGTRSRREQGRGPPPRLHEEDQEERADRGVDCVQQLVAHPAPALGHRPEDALGEAAQEPRDPDERNRRATIEPDNGSQPPHHQPPPPTPPPPP